MKNFRTELKITPSNASFDPKSTFLTQGSCFADAIGGRLATFKLKTVVNPFGVIYNPESIHKVLAYGIFNEPVAEHTFHQDQDHWVNFDVHSEFSDPKKETLAQTLLNTIGATHYFLKDANWLILTYGTAWVYHRKETGEIVANCHKLPSGMFAKSLLDAEDIVSSFKSLYDRLKKFNPRIRIILTVSPVRHLRDTHELNSVSKSILRVACHKITHLCDDVEYFPAYEIMMDDLRDYRFYRSDMLHPTAEAEDYIWERFMERYFSPELRDFVERWSGILSALRHKPFHPHSSAHQLFLRDTLRKLEELQNTVDTREEMILIKRQLTK
jgi:hypothetical protein